MTTLGANIGRSSEPAIAAKQQTSGSAPAPRCDRMDPLTEVRADRRERAARPIPPARNTTTVAYPATAPSGLSDSHFLATLLAIAGHDLRQPLQLITSAHDVLGTTLRDPAQREQLARAADASAQLARMLGQLVEAVRLHERRTECRCTPVPLQPIFADLAAEFGEMARLKGVAFRITATTDKGLSDALLLTSILRNLVRNAIDYTLPEGSVCVASHRRGDELHINVHDTGIGICANMLPTIFNAFQRADHSRAEGLGLGLFIVKRAVSLLGHRIAISSTEGCGSSFTVITTRHKQPGKTSPATGKPASTNPPGAHAVERPEESASSIPRTLETPPVQTPKSPDSWSAPLY